MPSLGLQPVGIRPWRTTRREAATYGESRHTDLGTLVLGRRGGPASGWAFVTAGTAARRSHDGPAGDSPLAIRHHHRLSLPVCPDHDRDGVLHRDHRDRLGPHPQPDLPPGGEVLGQDLPDQLRDGRRDRARPGVPVRDELVELLAVRRRRLRCAAGDGVAAGVLPGVDVHRDLDLRLGQAAPLACTLPASGWSRSARRCPRSSSSRRTRSCSTRWVSPSMPIAVGPR